MATPILFEDDVLRLLFHGETVDTIAQNVTTSPATTFYVSLLSGDPLVATSQNQTTNEIGYTGYARMPVPRTAAAWNVINGTVAPEEIIEFAVVAGATGTQRTATHFGVGTTLTGAGILLASGALVPPIPIVDGAEPRIDNAPLASRFPVDWI